VVAGPLPVGTVTLLFTDVEGSTRLLAAAGDKYGSLLETHQQLIITAIGDHGGHVVDTQGDSFFAAFASPTAGLEAAIQAQRSLQEHDWPDGMALRVRMGLHTGEVKVVGDKYVGMEVHRAARIGDAGHGDQILVSEATRFLVDDTLPGKVRLIDLGEYKLKDLSRPERIHQVVGPGLIGDFPPLRTVEEGQERFHGPVSPLIGRIQELKEITELVEGPEARLLTLTGPGGTGKTRLALEVAVDLQDNFDDGVVFVPLASVSSPDTVISAILQALGARESAGRSPLSTLIGYLESRHMLVVLDNFEHVMEAAPMLGEIMSASDRLKLLVTSREVLRLTAEWEFSVPPLSTPGETNSLEDVAQSEAVQLFIERAQGVDRGFALTPQNVEAVASICRLLDGLPLAIELAAARIRLLSPKDIATRLERDLDLLVGGPRDMPERQRALRSTIDWSYQLLDEADKTLFRRLGVFAGSWTLDAMAAVCATGDLDAFEGLASLVDKSLVYRRSDEDSPEARFSMLRSIREFAVQRLEEGHDYKVAREAHAQYFLELANRGGPHFLGSGQRVWSDLLNADIDNLRSAMNWFLTHDVGRATEMGWALWPYWWILNHFEEGATWMQTALESKEPLSQDARGKANAILGMLAFGRGDYDTAVVACKEALGLCEASGNDFGTGLVLTFLGVLNALDDPIRAEQLVTRATEKFQDAGNPWGEAFGMFSLGRVLALQERYPEAVDLIEEAIARIRVVGERVVLALALINLGWTRLALFDSASADVAFEEALQLLLEVKDTVGTARVLEGLAGASLVAGEPENAAVLFGAAEGARRSVGADVWIPDALSHERTENAIRHALGAERYEALWTEGTALTPEEVQPLATAAATHAR
jgi:predicted ATPase/class 3 adenylate cyclase